MANGKMLVTRWVRHVRNRYGSFDRRVYILSLGWLVTAAGFAMVIPYVSIYFHQELHLSTSLIGVFFGATAVLRSIPQPFAGQLSDRFGRVPIMSWSQIARSLTFGAVALAMLKGYGFWPIATIIGLNFIFGAFLYPAASAMVADLVPQDQRLAAFSFTRIAANLGWAIGPAFGGFLASKSYPTLFALGGLAALISGIFFATTLKDLPRPRNNENEPHFNLRHIIDIKRDGLLFRHCLITFLLLMTVAQLVAGMSLYSTGWVGISQSQLGFLFLVNGSMVVLFQVPITDMFRKMRLTHQMALGASLYFVGYFMVGFAGGFAALLFCIVIISIAEMIAFPPATTLVANLSRPEEYGRAMGIYGLFQTFGWSLGPTLGGFLLDVFRGQPVLIWGTISAMSLIAGMLYLNFARKLAPEVNSRQKIQESSGA